MNTKLIGNAGERIAKKFLKEQGYQILETNLKLSGVEVDIVAKMKDVVVFVEVKTRNSESYGRPIEAITFEKCKRYLRAVDAYMVLHRLCDVDFRIDVIEICDGEINHVVNAFGR